MKRAAVASLLLVVACQTVAGSSSEVYVNEFDIDPKSTNYKAGAITLEVENEGELGHTLVITDVEGHVVTAGDLLSPDETASITVNLAPGHYTFTCRIVGQDDEGNVIDHYERGMTADVVVSAG